MITIATDLEVVLVQVETTMTTADRTHGQIGITSTEEIGTQTVDLVLTDMMTATRAADPTIMIIHLVMDMRIDTPQIQRVSTMTDEWMTTTDMGTTTILVAVAVVLPMAVAAPTDLVAMDLTDMVLIDMGLTDTGLATTALVTDQVMDGQMHRVSSFTGLQSEWGTNMVSMIGTEDKTVNGERCLRACRQNREAGFYYCQVDEAGSWDFCCRPDHFCGYSRGLAVPWFVN